MSNQNPPVSSTVSDWSLLAKIQTFLYAGLIIIIAPLYLYMSLPVLHYSFWSFATGFFFVSVFIATLEMGLRRRQSGWLLYSAIISSLLSAIYILIMWLASSEMVRTSAHRNLIGEIKVGESFSKDIAPISLDDIRIVDQEVADRLGDKVLGEKPALGSQCEVGTFNIQKVGNGLFWVAPLLHTGYFKWLSNRSGTPAYVIVSATNERDVRMVTEIKGRPIKIKYQPAAFLGDNLQRHLYFSGFATTGLTDYTFEIDDEGNPYWVVTLYTNKIGFEGADAYGVAVVNAETGEIKQYGINDAPAWVDRIQPKEFVKHQLNAWGNYVNGYFNFSGAEKLTTTDGISLVYGSDNRSYWYAGLTSVGRDQGTVGFVLVDTRNKSATWYKQAGATEDAAQLSAKGKVQEKGYTASFPILYNINGVPTYVMSLKDNAGLIKMIALVSVEDYSIVGVGNDLKSAVRAYKDAYNGSGKDSDFKLTPTAQGYSVAGKLSRISVDVSQGNSYYYIYLDNVPNKIFIGSTSISNELPITQVGDSVLLKYDDSRTETVDLTSFDNLGLNPTVTSEIQIK